MNDTLKLWKEEADKLEPHHEYRDAEPSRSGKNGVRCLLCNHYTNGMERGSCSPCPEHAKHRILKLIAALELQQEALKKLSKDRQHIKRRDDWNLSVERYQLSKRFNVKHRDPSLRLRSF